MKRRNVALVVEMYYPLMSGVPVVMQYLAEGLVNRGYTVDVYTSAIKKEGATRKQVYHGVNINRYKIKNSPFYRIKGEREEVDEFVNKICSEEYQYVIITCAQCWTTNLLLPYLKQIPAKTVFYTHGFSGLSYKIEYDKGLKTLIGSIYRYFWMKLYYERMPRYLKEFDEIVYISDLDSAKEFCESKGILNGTVIYNAVEDRFFLNYEKKDLTKRYVLNVSNYTYVKNQEMLLESFYAAETFDYKLIIIGSQETEYTKRLYTLKKEFDKKYGYKDVEILHGIERERIDSIVRDATIFLMSSKWEQYSIALCEAMAEGVPFISTNVGNASILPGGIIADTIEEYSNAITTLLTDQDSAFNLGKEGREFALRHNKRSAAIDQLCSLLEG